MAALELVLFLLAAVVASSILDRLVRPLSLPLVQIALGALIGFFVATPLESGLDPELLLILFIAPLHFNESRHADPSALWKNRFGIASLAGGLVIAIALATGGLLHALVPAIPFSLALAFGAALGSTDAVAVTELSKDYRFGRRHEALLMGEAFFNDVTGTVLFKCCVGLAATGALSLAHAGEEFALELFGGMVGGAIMGGGAWLLFTLIRRAGIDTPTLHVTLELLLPFGIYLLASELHIGGVIAVVCAGLVMSLLPHHHSAAVAQQKLQSRGVWDTLSFILNGVIFVILGMQLPRILHPVEEGGLAGSTLLGAVLLITLVLELLRFVWIVGMDAVHAKREGRTVSSALAGASLKSAIAMSFAGPKGAITLSLMLTVPSTLVFANGAPMREAIISVTAGVILCTLLLADFAVPALVPHKRETKRTRARTDAELALVEGVIASIKEDACITGAVKGASSAASPVDGAFEADEPATVIVMKRYADQLRDLAPHASKEAAARARMLVAECDALYARIEDVARDLAEREPEEDSGALFSLSAHLDERQRLSAAVEDVQTQAFNRELELIRKMHAEGVLDASQAVSLRNDVYLQQIAL